VGLATLRACFKLWLGFPPDKAGVWSAGNGPAMRSPILGAFFARADDETLRRFVRASTRLTHTDPKAELGAMAAALAARRAALSRETGADIDAEEFLSELEALFAGDADALAWLEVVRQALREDWDGERFLKELTGKDWGISGYIYQTMPAVLWAWLKDPSDFAGGMKRIINLGGDADSTGAIYGGIAGAGVGAEGIPAEWINGVWEFPCSVRWTRRLADRLEALASDPKEPPRPLRTLWPLIVVRNVVFIAIILLHALRRLIP
jgi:ADP-ribosylglycohydrolase